ncbi:hydrogenase assembly chaperone HypC/HupF [Geoglobus ahangari]|uniref:Hydrogenase assembly chaperone HypC/HupF n=1 Tax=Geoglobus ahangari TaxID=113653 RepID=A0A0F7II48_9EURY|nr:HypC/HybG/HupF family hydrogenase formation chaperone [Geoglobus ahangari]AKG92449.1 hydrogenase assembly chaperone HypC/HupF [Geoglobus ahangari]NOY11808.1 HypC/HybG/HupF family hydrogenase formation chaperone [Archaeoglobi archaeon]
MCLAIPAEIVEVNWPYAVVDLNGAKRKVRVDLLDDVKPGDYVLIHVGLAIQKVSKKEVEEIESLWQKILED